MNRTGPRMGVLVVGVGFLGAQRAAAVRVARGARLVAVTDVRPEIAGAVASRHRALAVPGLSEGLRLPGVDAVIVATPHADHGPQVRQALEAGKHVLCEKPLAIDPDEARELAYLAGECGVRLATGFNHRFYPPVRDALRLASSGAIGTVESMRAQIGHRASSEFLSSWHTDASRSGGGTLMDNGAHACDLIRRFLGEVVAAQGYVHNDPKLDDDCETEAFALFRNYDRAVAELRSSWWLEEGYLTIDIRGNAGHLHLETAPWRLIGSTSGGRPFRKTYLPQRIIERAFRLRNGCERSLVHEIEEFVSPTHVHPRPGATGWDGCRATEMIQAVYESAATGKEVALKPLPIVLPGAPRRVQSRRSA
jgi:predicted dehydrogenase